VFSFKPGKEAKAVLEAHSYCRSIHDAKFKDDVSKAFNHFDADMSGEIDKEELGKLSEMLGNPLSDEQL
jgi:Ca2+-binding EF-hand superfamily protein